MPYRVPPAARLLYFAPSGLRRIIDDHERFYSLWARGLLASHSNSMPVLRDGRF
jgi:hypothetical protein